VIEQNATHVAIQLINFMQHLPLTVVINHVKIVLYQMDLLSVFLVSMDLL
jgi:hypothetical protein